uniref:Uncharacterized protein n=1 Tax=Vannella robusta TaxID=1487602 RepID=A0A7S4MU09_9EUKA|mmetsp:Transcript_9625/g.11899  ORF Transcript_9625/g.11899 Transcript_9625/m.11899 type:complete len:237 (+) Transcript_9625:74-784(+)
MNELYVAVYHRHVEKAIRLIEKQTTDINYRNKFGISILHLACKKTYTTRILKTLLSQRRHLDVNATDVDGKTALHNLCEQDWPDALRLLLADPRVSVSEQCSSGLTPLHESCYLGHCDMVNILVRHPDLDINAKNKNGRTSLYCTCAGYAESSKREKIVRCILEDERTALDIREAKQCLEQAEQTNMMDPIDLGILMCSTKGIPLEKLFTGQELEIALQRSSQNLSKSARNIVEYD